MDSKTFDRLKKIERDHTKHCSKCGLPSRDGCRFQDCKEVQHCACAMTQGLS